MCHTCLEGGEFMDRNSLSVAKLTDNILGQMESSGFMESTRGFYVTLFRKLCRMAEERGDTHYTFELGQSFISDKGSDRRIHGVDILVKCDSVWHRVRAEGIQPLPPHAWFRGLCHTAKDGQTAGC